MDYYEVLEVSPAATLDSITAAYRRLAHQYHPDLNTDPAAAEQMKAVNTAFDVLSDPAQRAAYDAMRGPGRQPYVTGIWDPQAEVVSYPRLRFSGRAKLAVLIALIAATGLPVVLINVLNR